MFDKMTKAELFSFQIDIDIGHRRIEFLSL